MVRPHETRIPADPQRQIAQLIRDFQQDPHSFLRESELHAHFAHLCRDGFPTYHTRDQRCISTLRCQYPTFWRYRRGDRFAQGYCTQGYIATFDFVVLNKLSVQTSDYLGVVRQDERRQRRNRLEVERANDLRYIRSCMVQCGIELKLAGVCDSMEVSAAEVNRFEDRLLEACCKLAQEYVEHAYVIGLSHGPQPDRARAYQIASACGQLHAGRLPEEKIYFAVATPAHTVLAGDVFERGVPAGQQTATGEPEAQ